MKICTSCKKSQALTCFRQTPRFKDGHAYFCKSCEHNYGKEYRKQHQKERAAYSKLYGITYRATHRKETAVYNKKYAKENKAKRALYYAQLRKDPMNRLNYSMSSGIYHALKRNKAGRHWETLVGYSLQDLINYIQPILKPGMTLENYGEWHIDHIKPKVLFTFETNEDPEFKLCWALSNLQPLWAKDNLRKGSKSV